MTAPASITKFYDANERPPQRGWHYFYDLADTRSYFRRASAEEVFDELKRFRSNNGKFVSDFDLWRELWVYWCAQEPGRCGQTGAAPASLEIPALKPREIDPPFFGPIIWRMMNLLAARFGAVGKDGFLDFITIVRPAMTCPECQKEWATILREHPPVRVDNTRQACEWVNRAHNLVNARRGVAHYPYERGVVEYGWPA